MIELEISLCLPASLDVPWVQAWLSNHAQLSYQRSTQLTNIYFDTPSQNLKHSKAALRLRFDDDKNQWLQTLKTVGSMHEGLASRHEWETPVAQQAFEIKALPAEAQAYLTPYVADLTAVFETNFQRDIYLYELEGNVYEFAFDHGEVITPQSQRTIIHELEIELIAGDVATMKHLANQTQNALAAGIQHSSKAARGYALLDDTSK